ncbi:competence/damage-inducible protein A [Pseudogracilibacillus auburnensis]|uniref:Putative competence-damage inducible protein n=1 Tax=Pseudogracilibacillus auburnensis TaxID=1494959 RepID=A0A2V3W303_9BACI|nr:competence/damage-inducible protein A [Pseudogracilibacillus auburnensis]MBO1003118.1 competence/damage-inducible protein A [Pseudogracilibacillus auburnensis]PXW88677.1 competence/damage-inducible protein cinA [Pseudogracilibacillus auburnensis]
MSKTINTEIIAVGTELLLGQIVNTNAQWISEQLALNGINTFYHTVVGDNLARLTAVFEQAQARSNVIIVTGGLGPTEDDLSREALQQFSNIPIIEEKHALQKIKQFYDMQAKPMTPNNKRQARVFKDSIILENKVGMAPGNIVDYKGVKWIFLPGVPREMKQILTDEVIPYLKKMNGEMILQSTVLRFIGIGESALEHKLQHIISTQQNPTIAPLAQKDGVTIRLTAKAKTAQQAQAMLQQTQSTILAEVGEYFYGINNESIEETVFTLLQKHHKRIASAESLTGGLFADKLVSLHGASTVFKGAIVCYDPAVKENVLHVPAEIIKTKGTVSEECAIALAKNIASLLHSSIGISFTGVAGPNEIEEKSVGTVFIGLYDENGYEHVEKCHFHGSRAQIRYRAVLKGYELLFNYLK